MDQGGGRFRIIQLASRGQLAQASRRVYNSPDETGAVKGNGIGSAILSGALSAAQALAPIALKALMPMVP